MNAASGSYSCDSREKEISNRLLLFFFPGDCFGVIFKSNI